MARSIIIDGNNTAHRCWHTSSGGGLPGGGGLRTKRGKPSGVVHGVLASICSTIDLLDPTHVYVVWDRRSRHRQRLLNNYRTKLERTADTLLDATPVKYKESRYENRTNEDHTAFQEGLLPQMRDLQYLLPHLGIHSLCVPEVEGDDLIGIANDILTSHGEVIVISTDRDLYQLLGPQTKLYDPFKKRFYTDDDFRLDYKIDPARFPEIKALVGDDSDDIPGVPKIGDKRAVELIQQAGDLVSLIDLCKEAPTKTYMTRIPEYEQQIKLAYDMSFILSSVSELDPDQEEEFKKQWTAPVAINWNEIHQFCDDYELRAVREDLKKTLQVRYDERMLAKTTTLDELFAYWGDCRRCGLCEERINIVKYGGAQQARVLVCGEGPGSSENIRGEPFVGKSGKYLEEHCLLPNGLTKDMLHILNIVCCRPTDPNGDNRPPSKEEVSACSPRLRHQIRIVNPKVVVLVGDKALKAFFPESGKISQERGADAPMEHPDFPGIHFVCVFHPSYLMRLRPSHSAVIKSTTDWRYIAKMALEDAS